MKKDFCGFLNTIGNSATTNNIIVTFIDGKEAEYTTNILNDLKSDPTVSHIIDSETGELLYMKEVSKPVKPTKSTMRKFKVLNTEKFLYQNNADEIITIPGSLIDNSLYTGKRGMIATIEKYVNCWTSEYIVLWGSPEEIEREFYNQAAGKLIDDLEEKITEYLTDYEYLFYNEYSGIDDFKEEVESHVKADHYGIFTEILENYGIDDPETSEILCTKAVDRWIDTHEQDIREEIGELMKA